jgi:hypothetical protein
MRRLSWWLEWPEGPIRVGVIFLVLATVVAVVVGYPTTLKDRSDAAARNAALSYADREIAGGNGLVADQQVVYEARARIPPDATYHVAVDQNFQAGSDLTVPYVAGYFHYALMPRRPAEDAPWIVCYGCDLAKYGESEVVWRNDDGISIARVRR